MRYSLCPYYAKNFILCWYPSLTVQVVEISREDEDGEKWWVTAWSTLFEWSGIGPIKPERVVFSDNSSSFTRFWLQCDQMCYLEYMQKNSAFTTGEYEVTRSSSSTTMMMMSSCALDTPTSGL